MSYIDLHVHSNKSDGTLTPAEVVRHAAAHGLAAIALTDHDSTAGIAQAQKEAEELRKEGVCLRVVPGVEISADYATNSQGNKTGSQAKKQDIHILGYLIDPDNPALQEALNNAIASRDARNEKMVKNLQNAGISITMDDLLFDAKDTVITRAHFARHLVAKGYVKDRNQAFEKYLGSDTPYYVCREYMDPVQAIRLIKNAGGIPVLAHPLLYHLLPEQVKELIAFLADAGLCGIEVMHSSHKSGDEVFLRQLANRFGLLKTGGSDFHGANKPDIEIGIGRRNLQIPMEMLAALDQFQKLHA